MSSLNVNTIAEYTSGNGVTIDGALIKDGDVAGLLKSAQTFRLTAAIGGVFEDFITSNWEVPDTENQGNKGSIVSESSGVFSFSETGYYLIMVMGQCITNTAGNVKIETKSTNDNSTYSTLMEARCENGNVVTNINSHTIIDVTNISNDKVKFQATVQRSDGSLRGSTTVNLTAVSFLKLGET